MLFLPEMFSKVYWWSHLGQEILFYSVFFFFLNFLFYIGMWLINNVVLVSRVQQSVSVIHTHVSVLFSKNFFPFRLFHNTEQSSLCYIGYPFFGGGGGCAQSSLWPMGSLLHTGFLYLCMGASL